MCDATRRIKIPLHDASVEAAARPIRNGTSGPGIPGPLALEAGWERWVTER